MTTYILTSIVVFILIVAITLTIHFVKNYTVVGANEMAVIAGSGSEGYRTFHGGRVVVWPLIHQRFDLDLRPHTTTVRVESVIAKGMIPLNVVATVSFAISSAGPVVNNAVRRILTLAQNWDELAAVASSIIEGHLRDSISIMTPHQVMRDKDQLVRNMIRVCKDDLEAIGLEITTMNITDVEDHRLEGMGEQDLYIELLNRVQSANAQAQARASESEAQAVSTEEKEARRAEVETNRHQNRQEALKSETSAMVAKQNQQKAVGIEEATRNAEADEAGVRGQIEAEKQRVEQLRAQYQSEIVKPAEAERDRRILEAQQEATEKQGQAKPEIDELGRTTEILQKGGRAAVQAYLIDNFDQFIKPFARTLDLFPAERVSVLSGAGESSNGPLSAIHPNPIAEEKARYIREAFGRRQDDAASVNQEESQSSEAAGVSQGLSSREASENKSKSTQSKTQASQSDASSKQAGNKGGGSKESDS